MTGRYWDDINYLVEEGIFPSRGEFFRDSLRRSFRAYGLKPYTAKERARATVKVSEISRG